MPAVYAVPLRTRFRGITVREGMLLEGPAGWGEWSPFLDYAGRELVGWLRCALEASTQGWPEPVRTSVPVNVTVPAVPADAAERLVADSGCTTAKVKVAEPGQRVNDDIDRVAAVRRALGPAGRVRIDANGAWTPAQALAVIVRLAAYDLEYVEQPCARVEELAELRRTLARQRPAVPIAADESIRRSGDPERVKALAAADIAVLKVQPLGGVRACLQLAERLGLPVVVSSALETSVGIAAGVALAGSLPRLDFACGLNTGPLLSDDVASDPLRAVDGRLAVGPVRVDDAALRRCAADAPTRRRWEQRLADTSRLLEEDA